MGEELDATQPVERRRHVRTVADVLVPLWHPKRQTLHDLAARTQVVRLR